MQNKIKIGAKIKVRVRHVNANSSGGRIKEERASVLGIYGNFVLLGFRKYKSCAYTSDLLRREIILV